MTTTNQRITDKDFYYCYDVNLSKHLKTQGILYVIKAKSIVDNKVFTMYQKSQKLYDAVELFAHNK